MIRAIPVFLFGVLFAATSPSRAQRKFTLEQILSPAFCYELVAAKHADRIAWLANERGRRNVYTAAAPDFRPVRLTAFLADDGNDLTSLRISGDGSTVVFVRGHKPNRDGWIANPTSHPDGMERAVWAARTSGGEPFKVIVGDDPVLSPDGSWIVFVREGQIHGVRLDSAASPAKTTAPLFRTLGTNRDPVWSPDGTKIAFTSDRGDHSFIGVYDRASRAIRYMSPSVDRDSSPTWSPDGTRIAFLRMPGLPFGRSGGRADRFRGRTTGRREARASRRRGGASAGGGRRRAATPKGYARAAFAGGYTLSMRVADLASGRVREFWHDEPGGAGSGRVRRITWAGDHAMFQLERNDWRHYYSVPIAGTGATAPVDLTPGAGIAEHIGLSADGKTLFYSSNVGDIDRRHIWRVSTAGGAPRQITQGKGIETFPAALASAGIALLSASARQPQSVALLSAAGAPPRVIFPALSPEFPLEEQVEPVNVVLTAADGLRFHNQVFVPPDLAGGERRAAILFTHGGPIRQMLLGYHYRGFYHTAYAMNQYLCNRGYIVLSANYRGGIGYGRKFRQAPRRGANGNAEYQDVLAAGKYLQGRPDVDPKRIGLWGLSYGGLITAQGLARNSDIFAAGVDMAGVHHWGSASDPNSTAFKSSPIAAIETWRSPVLLIHADDDRNVAFSQTTGLVQMLRAHEIPHEVIVYPDDVHVPLLHTRWLHAYRATAEFFDRHLKPGAGAREASRRQQRKTLE